MSSDGIGVTESSEETERERTTRKWNEMLQELRVAQTGIQILTGFLLTLPFSQRFGELDRVDKLAYLVTVSSSILSAGLIIAPVAFHRVLFGKSEKDWLIRAANRTAQAGLSLMAITMSGVMFLVFGLVVGPNAALIATSTTLLVLTVLWAVVPWMGRKRDGRASGRSTPAAASR